MTSEWAEMNREQLAAQVDRLKHELDKAQAQLTAAIQNRKRAEAQVEILADIIKEAIER